MERARCRAVVLGRLDYGESDRIVTLFTDDRGKVSAFARGARASRRRFAGLFEPFSLLEVTLVETRGSMLRLDAAALLDAYAPLREEVGRVARAAYAAELVRELCREREPHPDLFRLLCEFFDRLARRGAGAVEMLHFELGALAGAGLMPRLDACARCGATVAAEPAFDPGQGGVLCEGCAPARPAGLSARTAAALVALQRTGRPEEVALTAAERAEARQTLAHFVTWHLGRRPKTLDFMRQMGVES